MKVYENEEKWLNYDEEETEVSVEIGDVLFNNMATTMIDDLLKIKT